MSFFNFLFRKKPITYLGRGGINYFDGKNDFCIDTNNIQGDKLTIEIFREDIKSADRVLLTDLQKKQVAFAVKKILEKDNIDVIITPPLSMDFIIENT
jgi:CO dehydrogenase/acetyl-CoA synthase epsilon subunit